jgi:hypothetical protein
MTLETLQAILRSADGVTEKNGVFRIAADHRVTFYLGNEGHNMTVNEVEEIKLDKGFAALLGREAGFVYAEYAAVYALSIKPPKPNSPKKAGFA